MTPPGFIFASGFDLDQKHLKVLVVLGQTDSRGCFHGLSPWGCHCRTSGHCVVLG